MVLRRLAVLSVALMLLSASWAQASGSLQNQAGKPCPREGRVLKTATGELRCSKSSRGLFWRVTRSSTTTVGSPTTTLASLTTVSQCASGGTCRVGDTGPGGGTVFYVSDGGFACGPTASATCRYLESAPTSGANAWTDVALPWSLSGVDIGARGVAIGTGHRNTVVAFAALGGSAPGGAIGLSRAYRGPNNKDDWYLPSKDEAYQLFLNRSFVGGLAANLYWTSTEIDRKKAWTQYFTDSGTQRGNVSRPDTSVRARAIRAFNVPGSANTIVSTCASGGVCFVGDIGPGGGDVFFVSDSGFACGPTLTATCRYLESAPISGPLAWVDADYVHPSKRAATGTELGKGYQNTLSLIAVDGAADRAAAVTRAYRGPNNKDDWFLPSRVELGTFLTRNSELTVLNIYWSSSYGTCLVLRSRDGTSTDSCQAYTSRDVSSVTSLHRVRPIRAF